MKQYIIKHKHCDMTKTIEGYTIWDAFRGFNIDPKMWNVISAEKIYNK